MHILQYSDLAPEVKVVSPFVNLTIWFKHALTGSAITSTPQVKDSHTPSHTPSGDDFTSSHNGIHGQSNIITPQEKVFEYCKSPKSIAEIANMLGVNDRRWVRKKYIAPFIGTKLQMTIPDKPNSQNQKYITIYSPHTK